MHARRHYGKHFGMWLAAGDTMADGKGKHCEQEHYGNVMSDDHKEKPLQTTAY
jgi:hypothetical protein